ncbi:hypothetical protein Q7P37_007857 [Cladosporium fusiforme]
MMHHHYNLNLDREAKAAVSLQKGVLKFESESASSLQMRRLPTALVQRRRLPCLGNHAWDWPVNAASAESSGVMAGIPVYPGGKTLYINALEERIAFLEAHMPGHADDHFIADQEGITQPALQMSKQPTQSTTSSRRGSLQQSHGGSTAEDVGELDDRTSLVDGVAYLSLCASGSTDTASEPYYVGSSSGATIAQMIQSSIFRGASTRGSNYTATASSHQNSSTSERTTPPSSEGYSHLSTIDFPHPEQARMLFDMFFERIHTRWPLLDRVVYEDLFTKQYISGGLTVIERSIFHLIYAITARFLTLTRQLCSVDSERHLAAATEPMDIILEQHSLVTLQFLVLLGVHGQRSPYGAGAWSQIRYALSVCIEMGLHRKRTKISSVQEARDVEIRRRIFWSCYCLDRATSIVLGRAFAISDRDINVELPSAGGQFWTLTHNEPRDPSKGPWSNVEPFVHIIKLDKINSRIYKAVFRVDRDVQNGSAEERARLDDKMAAIKTDLDEWLRTCPQTPKHGHKTTWMYDPESAYLDASDFYGVQYHKAVLFLYTALLPDLKTSDPRFITCARSAESVCTAYKRLNQNRTLTYTMISLHSCFVAGLTMVYCIWRDRSLFSYDSLEATRDCSQSLTIFGEKWPGAVKYRDIFDALSGNLLKSIVNPGPGTSQSNHQPLKSTSVPPVPLQNDRPDRAGPGEAPHEAMQSEQPPMGHMVSEAVKEAFMEVDGEAPGGWQGWRMWDEMVSGDTFVVPDSIPKHRDSGYGLGGNGSDKFEDLDFYGVDPVQDATMNMGNFAMMGDAPWNVDGIL